MTDDLDQARLERELRASLHEDAARWTPGDRWEDVWGATREEVENSRIARWPVMLAVAATALAVVFGYAAWGRSPQPLPPAGAPASPGAPTPRASATASSPAPAVVPQQWSAPVYYTASIGDAADAARMGLFRRFQPVPMTSRERASDEVRIQTAVELSLRADRLTADGGSPPAEHPWGEVRVTSVRVAEGLVTIGLTGPGPGSGSAEANRLAVQQLVWTAQAALGRGNVPVTFALADGSSLLQGQWPAADRYLRPAETGRDLAPIWILTPDPGAELPGSRPIEVSGQASVFEAALSVVLEDESGTAIATNTATASIGAPGRGDWSTSFAAPPPGSYRIVALTHSPRDGSIAARDTVQIVVR